jgi:nucleoside-diphosphate-sugar epimerase
MKILVCGCTGFMGRNIAEYFVKKGHEVYGVANLLSSNKIFPESVPVTRADLTSKTGVNYVFEGSKYDIVIQAAAVTSGSKDITERPYIHVTDNAIMNSLILRACYDYNVKHFVFLSCGVMYQPGEEPRKEEDFNEHDSIHPSYFGVGWTKVYIEKMCEFYSLLGKTKHTVIRHSNTYGPYDKYDLEHSHMFGATVRKVMDAKDGDTINIWGTGEETERDLIYVTDVIDLINLIIYKQSERFDLINAGYECACSVKSIVDMVIEKSGKKLNRFYDISKPVISTSLTLDCSKAKEKYKWRASTHIQTGIEKTLEWYKEYYNVNT